jgi:MYXO-CTERM domain-containing protein
VASCDCVSTTCVHNFVDGSVTYACLLCGPGSPATDGGADAGEPSDAGASADGAPASDAAAAASGGGASGGCSCSIESADALRGLAPWLLAALVPLALRRRRPRA